MPAVFAQSVVEYGGASSVLSVIGERFNAVYNTVSISVSDHPMLWGAAYASQRFCSCVAGELPRRAAMREVAMRLRLMVVAALVGATTALHAQAPAPATPESLVLAAKRAAGQDYAGTFLRICVAPDNLATGTGGRGAANAAPAARVVPDRATWYAQPYKVFDNLYFIGTRIHSAWALTTSDGIIIIDTLFDYAIEPEIVEGLSGLGLNPRDIKVRRDQPRAWRPRPGRGALAKPLRRQGGDGCGGLGLHVAAALHCRRWGAEARRRRWAGRPEDHAR
jgi:hypothetical protein